MNNHLLLSKMARPKTISDSDLLDRAFEVISREGFESFTFQQVGRAVGLSAPALVKRFKSKRRLALLARNQKWERNLSRMNADEVDALSGLDGISGFLLLIARSVDSKRLGEHASWLGAEASDPRSKRKVALYFEQARSILKRLLHESVKKGELAKEIDPESFAVTLEALIQGSIFQFAFLEKRNIKEHLESHVRAVLKPFLL